jgi:hypothetical protein
VWHGRAPISDWVLWPIYLTTGPILLSVALWVIDKPVFALRGHPYYSIFILQLLHCSLSPYAAAGVFRRLHRDFGGTTPVPAVLFSVAAFIPGYRYLYRETWYLVISIIFTSVLIYRVQYHAVVKGLWRDWRRGHSIARQGLQLQVIRTVGPGIGRDDEILPKLTALEGGLNYYKANFSHLRGGYGHNVQDTAVKEGVENIIRVLILGLSPEARLVHRSNLRDVTAQKIKSWFTVSFFVAEAATVTTLIFQPDSLVQAVVSVIAGGCMMVIWIFLHRYSIHAFTDHYVPKMAGLFWSLFHVNLLLLKRQKALLCSGEPMVRFSSKPSCYRIFSCITRSITLKRNMPPTNCRCTWKRYNRHNINVREKG